MYLLKNKLLIVFAFIVCVNIKAQKPADSMYVRHTIDSILNLKQSIMATLGKDQSILISKLPILKKYPASSLQFICYQTIADVKTRNGENELAKQYIDTCFMIAEKMSNKRHFAKTLYTQGIYFKFNGKSDAAIRNWFQAVELFKKEKDVKAELSSLAAIAREYSDLDQYGKAEKYTKEVIEKSLQHNEEQKLSSYYNLMANILTDTKRFEEAITYFKKAEILSQKNNDTTGLAYMNNNIARVFNKQDKMPEAEFHWKKSYDLFMRTSDAFGKAIIINNMAYINIKLNKYNDGIAFAKRAIEFSTENDIQIELQRAHSNLLDAYYGLNDFKNGFKEYEIIIDMKDAQFNTDVANALADAEQKYKTKIQQDSITILSADKKVSNLLLDEQKTKAFNYKISFLVTLLLISVIGAIIYFNYKNKQAKQKLIQQQLLNVAVLETEQQERERIARDLHDSVGQKLSVVKMQLSMKNSDNNATSNLLDEAIQDVRNVSHNLMPADLSKGLIVALENMCEQINYSSTLIKVNLNKTDAISNLQLDKQHTLLIYRMVQELVNNAIKYSQAKNININMDCQKNQLQLDLIDDGIGFDIESLKTKNGLGIKSIKERVQQLIGNIKLTSSIGKGTQFNISIPL